MFTTILVLLLSVQDDAARAHQLLEESAAVLRKSKHILIEVESKVVTGGVGGQVEKHRIILGMPDLLRFETRQGDDERMIIQDGQYYWFLDKTKNEYRQYQRQSLPPAVYATLPAILFYTGSARGHLGLEIKASKHKDGNAITWVDKSRGKPRTLWIWLGKDSVPHSYSEEWTLGDGTAYDRDDEYKIDLNPKIDDSTFKFVPPPGAKLTVPLKIDPGTVVPDTKEAKEATEILKQTIAALRAGPALAYEAEVSTAGPSERSWKIKAVAQRPDRYREEAGEFMYISDGTDCWSFNREQMKHGQFKLAQRPLSVSERLIGLYLSSKPDDLLVGAAEIEIAKADGADIISWSQVRQPSVRHWLKIDSKTRLPKEYSSESTIQDEVYRYVCKYVAFDVVNEPAGDAFKFVPPLGSTVWSQQDSDWERNLLAPGTAAPALVGKDPDGKDISLAEFKGKPVFLFFGVAILKDLRWLQQVQDAFGKRLAVVAVCGDDGAKAMRERIAAQKFTFSALCHKGGFDRTAFGARAHGTLYIIRADGKVAARMLKHEHYGFTEQKLRAALEKVVAGR